MNLSFNPDFLLFSSELLWKLFKIKSDLFMGVAQQCSVSTVAPQQEGGPDGTFYLIMEKGKFFLECKDQGKAGWF